MKLRGRPLKSGVALHYLLITSSLFAGVPTKRNVHLSDIPEGLRPSIVSSEAAFDALRRDIEQRTVEHQRLGNEEHLISFILQSNAFTKHARIELALSAREFANAPSAAVRARMADFLYALHRRSKDEKLKYWRTHLAKEYSSVRGLSAAYTRAMRLLQDKEFVRQRTASALSEHHGYGSDTQMEANFAVSAALDVIKGLDAGARIERVLIVGPGLEFAPRAGFRDDGSPQSFQPYAVIDILLRRDLAGPGSLSIHCVDIDHRVVDFIEDFARQQTPSLLVARGSNDRAYAAEFNQLGRKLGMAIEDPHGKKIYVRNELARTVSAAQLNILTERYDPSPQYDLVIATNVLLYFSNKELALALANIQSMLRPGGYFIHNELRQELEAIANVLEMPIIQAHALQLAPGMKRPLIDAFVVHRGVRDMPAGTIAPLQ
jgi:hypothetical protein